MLVSSLSIDNTNKVRGVLSNQSPSHLHQLPSTASEETEKDFRWCHFIRIPPPPSTIPPPFPPILPPTVEEQQEIIDRYFSFYVCLFHFFDFNNRLLLVEKNNNRLNEYIESIAISGPENQSDNEWGVV